MLGNCFSPDQAAWDRFRLLSQNRYQGDMDKWPEIFSLDVKQCRQCGHLWHHTQPDFSSIIGMYESAVSLTEKDAERNPNDHMLRSMDSLYRLAAYSCDGHPTLLDYGSEGGRWTRAAVEVGYLNCGF